MAELDEDGVEIREDDALMYDFEVALKDENRRLRNELILADEMILVLQTRLARLMGGANA